MLDLLSELVGAEGGGGDEGAMDTGAAAGDPDAEGSEMATAKGGSGRPNKSSAADLVVPSPWDQWQGPREQRASLKVGYAFHLRPRQVQWDYVWNKYLWLDSTDLNLAGPSILTDLPESVYMTMAYYDTRRCGVPMKLLFDMASTVEDVEEPPDAAFVNLTLPRSKNISRASQLVTASSYMAKVHGMRVRTAAELRLFSEVEQEDCNFLVAENSEEHVLLELPQDTFEHPNAPLIGEQIGHVGHYGRAATGWTQTHVALAEQRARSLDAQLEQLELTDKRLHDLDGSHLDPYTLKLHALKLKALKRRVNLARGSKRVVPVTGMTALSSGTTDFLLSPYSHLPYERDFFEKTSGFVRRKTHAARVVLPKSEDGMNAIVRLILRHNTFVDVAGKMRSDPGPVAPIALDQGFNIEEYMDGAPKGQGAEEDGGPVQENPPRQQQQYVFGPLPEIASSQPVPVPPSQPPAQPQTPSQPPAPAQPPSQPSQPPSPPQPSEPSSLPSVPSQYQPPSPPILDSQELMDSSQPSPAPSPRREEDDGLPKVTVRLLPQPEYYTLQYTFAKVLPEDFFRRLNVCLVAYSYRAGLSLTKVRSDGNCLFSSLAELCLGDKTRYMDIKKICYDWIVRNYDSDLLLHNSLRTYLEDRSRDNGAWGEMVDVQACADFFHLTINIISGSEVISDREVTVSMQRVSPREDPAGTAVNRNVFLRFAQSHYDPYNTRSTPFNYEEWVTGIGSICHYNGVDTFLPFVMGEHPPPPEGPHLSGRLALTDEGYEDLQPGDSVSQIYSQSVAGDGSGRRVVDVRDPGLAFEFNQAAAFSTQSTARTSFAAMLVEPRERVPQDLTLAQFCSVPSGVVLTRETLEEAVVTTLINMADGGFAKSVRLYEGEVADANDQPLTNEQMARCLDGSTLQPGANGFDRAVEILRSHTVKPPVNQQQQLIYTQDPPGVFYKDFFFHFYEMVWALHFGPLAQTVVDQAVRPSVHRNAAWLLAKLMPRNDEASAYNAVAVAFHKYETAVLGTASGWTTVWGESIPQQTRLARSDYPALAFLNAVKPMRFPTPFTSYGPHLATCGKDVGVALGRVGFDPQVVCTMIGSVTDVGWNNTVVNENCPVETVLAAAIKLGANITDFAHLSSSTAVWSQAYRAASAHMGIQRRISIRTMRDELARVHAVWGLTPPPEDPSRCYRLGYLKLLMTDPERASREDLINQMFLDALLAVNNSTDAIHVAALGKALPNTTHHGHLDSLMVATQASDTVNSIEPNLQMHELVMNTFSYLPKPTFQWVFPDTDPVLYAKRVWDTYVRDHDAVNTFALDRLEVPGAPKIQQLQVSTGASSFVVVDGRVIVDLLRTACYLKQLSGITSFAVIAARHLDVMPEVLLAVCVNLAMSGRGVEGDWPPIFKLVSSFAVHHHHALSSFAYTPPYELVDLRFLHCAKPDQRVILAVHALLAHRVDRSNHSERLNEADVIKVGSREISCEEVLRCLQTMFQAEPDYFAAFWSGEPCQLECEGLVALVLLMAVKHRIGPANISRDTHLYKFLTWRDGALHKAAEAKTFERRAQRLPYMDYLDAITAAVETRVADLATVDEFIREHTTRWYSSLVDSSQYPYGMEKVIAFCDQHKELLGLRVLLARATAQVRTYFTDYNAPSRRPFPEYQQLVMGWPALFTPDRKSVV